jgi:hypothetical protein
MPHPDHLSDAARVIAVGLVDLRLQPPACALTDTSNPPKWSMLRFSF